MSARAPGFDPQAPSAALQRAEVAESTYMDGGDGDSEERLHTVLSAALEVDEMAKAMHDGPLAQEQYRAAGIAPHAYETCEYANQYRRDAQAIRAVLLGPS